MAFLFPGQGSQRVGMGADLLAARPDLFDRYFAAADEAAGVPVLGLPLDAVEELCAEATATVGLVTPANLNAPTQIVVSGEVAGVEAVVAAAPARGAMKAVRLQVGAAFHSPLMDSVQARMAELM